MRHSRSNRAHLPEGREERPGRQDGLVLGLCLGPETGVGQLGNGAVQIRFGTRLIALYQGTTFCRATPGQEARALAPA